LQPRPAARPGLATDARHSLYLGEKSLVAKGLILVQGQADVIDSYLIQFCSKEDTIRGMSSFIAAGKRLIQWVTCEPRIRLS